MQSDTDLKTQTTSAEHAWCLSPVHAGMYFFFYFYCFFFFFSNTNVTISLSFIWVKQ